MALRFSGNDEMLPISSVNKIDGRFYAILYTEPHIDYSDPSTRVTASGRGPSLGMGSRGKGSLRGVALSGAQRSRRETKWVPALARLWRVRQWVLCGPVCACLCDARRQVRTRTGRPRIPGRSFGLSSKPTCGTEGDLCPFSPQNAVRHQRSGFLSCSINIMAINFFDQPSECCVAGANRPFLALGTHQATPKRRR